MLRYLNTPHHGPITDLDRIFCWFLAWQSGAGSVGKRRLVPRFIILFGPWWNGWDLGRLEARKRRLNGDECPRNPSGRLSYQARLPKGFHLRICDHFGQQRLHL